MRRFLWALAAFVVLSSSWSAAAAGRAVAVTLDDLPVGQGGARGCEWKSLQSLTERVLRPIRRERVPATAFVIAGHCPDLTMEQRRTILRAWQDAGVELGNHTWSHPNLDNMPVSDFEQDILRADAALRETLGVDHVRWFRFPMLHTGPDPATKALLAKFLADHNWRQGVVTFDNSDWMFAFVHRHALEHGDKALASRVRDAYLPYLESVIAFFETRSVEVVGHEFPQVLLLHANLLNAEKLGDVLSMLKRRGYRFVSLEEALKDPAYSLPEEYAGRGGFSWIHRWSRTMKMPNKGEPDEPAWLQQEYRRISSASR